MALGLGRLVMILADLMCDAPSPVPERQLRELGIAIRGQGK